MGFRPREKQTFSNVDIGRVTWPPAIRHTERLSERRQDWYRSFASVPPAQSIHYLHIRPLEPLSRFPDMCANPQPFIAAPTQPCHCVVQLQSVVSNLVERRSCVVVGHLAAPFFFAAFFPPALGASLNTVLERSVCISPTSALRRLNESATPLAPSSRSSP